VPGVHADRFNMAVAEAERRILPISQRQRAEELVAEAKDFNDARELGNVRQDIANLASNSGDPTVKAALSQSVQLLDEKLSELYAKRADEEMQRYEAFSSTSGGGLDALVEAKRREGELTANYAALLDHPEFKVFNERRMAYRQKLIAQNIPALSAKVAAAQSTSAVQAVIDNYFVPRDETTPAAAPLRDAIAKHRLVIAPFSDINGGEYLNAVYGGDWNEVRHLDHQYLAGLTAMLDNGPIGNMMRALISKASVLVPVLRTYLFNYDSNYERCLRPDAATFTLTSRTDQVTTNSVGMETARIYGSPTATQYRVNREFIEAFRFLGRDGQDDRMMLGGKTAETLSATRTVMNRFKCDDPRIKRLETNMLLMYGKSKTI
jgi:hypothetical protein